MKINRNNNDADDVYMRRCNTFFSAKNNAEIFYETEQEHWLIEQFETDWSTLRYEKFLLPLFDSKTGALIEDCTGFFVEKADYCGYIVISDYLNDNRQYVWQIKKYLNAGKTEGGEVTVLERRNIFENEHIF